MFFTIYQIFPATLTQYKQQVNEQKNFVCEGKYIALPQILVTEFGKPKITLIVYVTLKNHICLKKPGAKPD